MGDDGVSKAYSMHPVKTIIDLFESKKGLKWETSNAKMSEEMNVIILLLASEPLIRKVLTEILESKGYIVVTASGLGEADRLAEALYPRPFDDSPLHGRHLRT